MKLHAGAIVFLALALLCYFLAYLPGAAAFGVIGVVFEFIAWFVALYPDDPDPPPPPPG